MNNDERNHALQLIAETIEHPHSTLA